MSKVSIEKVISVSSEHPDHLASNIFSDSSGYWTCNSKGEKQASVVVQLQRSTKVTSVHVGNYGSGFVEVLVGKATSLKEEDFKVLLLCSSLMTLQDSRNEKNMQGVKMFSVAKLNAETRDQYWDRVKVVCTQPFNNHLYGLTFFKLMGESHEVQTSSYSSANALASLTVPSTSSELAPDTIKIGSFFKNRQSLTNSIALNSSTKPTISKQNSKEDISKNTPTKTSVSIASEMRVNSPSTLVAKDSKIEDNSKESPLTGSKPPRKMPNWEMKTPSSASKTTKHKLTRENSQESTEKKLTPVKKERKLSVESASKKPAAPAVKYDKFECLMKDVVFCLSGFVNPLRGELRQKALAMGAKYKQDWDNATSTHLICAFANTPKFNQVQKSSPSAHIVKKEWILDCHQNRTRHNLTNYSLIPLSDQTKDEPEIKASSEGDNSDANEPKSSTFSEKKESQTIRTSRNTSKARGQMKEEESDSAYDVETDEEYDPYQDMENEDDQLVSMPTKPTKKETPDKTEALNLENVELPPLPDFFKRRKFLLFGSFDSELRRMMKRLIIAYNGVLMDYMGEDVNYIVTSESWSDKFDQVLEDNSSVQFVRPSWLTACDSQQKAVPLQYHLVPPT